MMLHHRLLFALIPFGLLAACSPAEDDAPRRPAVALTAQDVALNNRGVGLMGSFDYTAARAAFAEAVERQPAWAAAKVNLAIATLNLQTEEDERRALELAAEVLVDDPGHLRAHYVSGLLKLYRSRVDEAAAHFRAVLDGDPRDAYAAYYLAQCLESTDRESALALYERAQASDPYLRSAYYGAALLLRRMGQVDAAKANLAVYTRMADNPRARLAEFKYTRMGDKGSAKVAGLSDAPAPAPRDGPLLDAPAILATLAVGVDAATLSVADVDGDGILDLTVANGADQAGQFFAGAEDELQPVDKHPLARARGVRAVAWGDVDNDGLVDAYLCRDGANALMRQEPRGVWSDVARASGTLNGDARCADVAFLDADHDGDLDIFIANEDAPSELLSNNLDGTFRALGGRDGLDLAQDGGRQVLASDLDNDRDVDLIVIRRQPPHQIFLNDRLWAYRAAPEHGALLASDIDAAVTADIDGDGRTDLVTAGGGKLLAWRQAADGALTPSALATFADGDGVELAAVEMDGHGQVELLVRDADAVRVLAADGGVLFESAGRYGAALPILGDARAGPGLLATREGPRGTELLRFAPGSGRGGFVAFTFSGKEEVAESMRSNRSGIGTRVALRTGSNWSLGDTLDHHSGPGQSLQPLALAAGAAARADYVALTWSDGVFQTELDVAAGELHALTETQRQLSSCPVVFAWDGDGYGFVSDVLGVAGIGFLHAPGRYSAPRPWEYFLLPQGALVPRDGELALKINEPMEEIAYVDQARVHIYDLAPPWSIVVDERMATAAPAATGAPLFYRRELTPARALDAHGNDVTAALRERDGVAASPGELDARFIGRTRRDHSVLIEFDAPLDVHAGRPVLIADGWVEYPYSQTVFAAWQAGAAYVPPTLDARDTSGRWHTVYANVGYPAGMPRRMALPLDDLPTDTVALRLTSSLQLYWDRLAVALTEAPPDSALRVLEAPLARATVRHSGFARRSNGPQRRPHYDYAQRAPLWDSRHLAGWYTAFGPAEALVTALDDAYAIVGPGEELDLRFAAPAPPADGHTRHFVLELRGYAKDMDLYTRDGGRVEPLPRTDGISPAQRAAAREALHSRYNTRYEAGH